MQISGRGSAHCTAAVVGSDLNCGSAQPSTIMQTVNIQPARPACQRMLFIDINYSGRSAAERCFTSPPILVSSDEVGDRIHKISLTQVFCTANWSFGALRISLSLYMNWSAARMTASRSLPSIG